MNQFKINGQDLYDIDYQKWLQKTLEVIKNKDYENLDRQNLIAEIEDMVKSEKRSIKIHLILILIHLLKWQLQPEHRSGSWESIIIEHRRLVKELLNDSPSLQPYVENILEESYAQAVKQAKAETKLPLKIFPQFCPYSLTDILNDEFMPVEMN